MMVLLWLLVLPGVVVDDAPGDVDAAGGDANGEGVVGRRCVALSITITGGAAVLTNAYDTYAHQHQVQHLHHPSQRHQQHHRQHHPAISVTTGNLRH